MGETKWVPEHERGFCCEHRVGGAPCLCRLCAEGQPHAKAGHCPLLHYAACFTPPLPTLQFCLASCCSGNQLLVSCRRGMMQPISGSRCILHLPFSTLLSLCAADGVLGEGGRSLGAHERQLQVGYMVFEYVVPLWYRIFHFPTYS